MAIKDKVKRKVDFRVEKAKLKHRKIFNKLVESGGSKSITALGREEGYGEGYLTSSKITKTKSWQQLLEEYLSDDKLAKAHSELLNAKSIDHYVFPLKTPDEKIYEAFSDFGFKVMRIMKSVRGKYVYFAIPDNNARAKALQMAYELKQKYGEDPFKHKFARYSKGEIVEFIVGRITRNGGSGGILGD